MKHKNLFFLILIGGLFSNHTTGQGVIKGFEEQEIFKISHTYKYTPSLSFTMQIDFADSARQDIILEQMTAFYKIQNGLYWAMIDSTEVIQGRKFNITVFHQDSIIAISNSKPDTDIMQLPLIDSLFRAQNIDSMAVTDLNDSVRILEMFFNPMSQYNDYSIIYNPETYLMNSIHYYVKMPAYDEDSEIRTSVIKVIYSNYAFGSIDDSYFQEDKFIYKQDGRFYTTSAYSDFQLMVEIQNQ